MMDERRILSRTESTTTTELDPKKIDQRILEYTAQAAQQKGIMPDGWMMSYHPDNATEEELQAPEWDEGVQRYAEKLREMASELDARMASGEIADTTENRVAAHATRTALLREANMYYSPVEKRPSVPLTAFFHPESQTKRTLALLDKREAEPDAKQRVLIGRMAAIETELSTLFGFVEKGGWKIASEKNRFCDMLEKITSESGKESYKNMWLAAGGNESDFQSHWGAFSSTVANYKKKFESIEAPETPKMLGEAHIQQYFETIGVQIELEAFIKYCDAYATRLREKITQIKTEHPGIPETSHPANDTEILERARAAAGQYIQWCRAQGIVPNDFTLPADLFVIKPGTSVGELSIASTSPDGGKISFQGATATEAWSTNWGQIDEITRHELTHYIQSLKSNGFQASSIAKEGAAVAAEWLQPKNATPSQKIAFLQAELRRVMRVKMGIEFHSGKKTYEKLHEDAPSDALIATEYQKANVVDTGITSFELASDYFIGSLLITALAHSKYKGNREEAMVELGKNGFRLPGHASITQSQMRKFDLLSRLPSFETAS